MGLSRGLGVLAVFQVWYNSSTVDESLLLYTPRKQPGGHRPVLGNEAARPAAMAFHGRRASRSGVGGLGLGAWGQAWGRDEQREVFHLEVLVSKKACRQKAIVVSYEE